MTDVLPFLKSLISVAGLSGHEFAVADLIARRWTPLVREVTRSKMGSIHALKSGRGKAKRPALMFITHMDSVGLMVARITDGFLHLAEIGHLDARVLPGTPVSVHTVRGAESLPGVIAMLPMPRKSADGSDRAPKLDQLVVDTGLRPRDVEKRIAVGDLVSFNTEPTELTGRALSGHALDNRASIASLTLCLEDLQSRPHDWDVWAVASVQEEIAYAGASTSAFELAPTIAVAIDVTFAKGPGASERGVFPLGKGPTLGIGPAMHPYLRERLKAVAKQADIELTDEAVPAASSTDLDAVQVTADGIPTALISIPLRYMHSPVEVVSMRDIESAGRLLAEFAASLEADFMEHISWD